jgi:glycosyltransferase involved in cell wall biosynthesis
MSRAAHIIAVSDQIASAIQKSAPDCAPVSVIPNGYDPEDFIHLPPAPPGDRFTLTYVGAMTPARNPEPLFRGLSRLFDRRPALKKEIEVRLIGAALGLDIGAMIREYDLIGVARQSGYLPHREALTQLLASDALVLLITSPDALTGGVPTGKIYEYLASGRPILGIAPPGVATDMIRRFNRGASASPEQPEAIARLIEEQVEMKKSGRLRIFPVDDESVRQFGRPFLTRQLAGILDHVTTQPL